MTEEQRSMERIAPEVNIDSALTELRLAIEEDRSFTETQRADLGHAIVMIEQVSDSRCRVMPIRAELSGGGMVINSMDRVHITAKEKSKGSLNKAELFLTYKNPTDRAPVDTYLMYTKGSKPYLAYHISKHY